MPANHANWREWWIQRLQHPVFEKFAFIRVIRGRIGSRRAYTSQVCERVRLKRDAWQAQPPVDADVSPVRRRSLGTGPAILRTTRKRCTRTNRSALHRNRERDPCRSIRSWVGAQASVRQSANFYTLYRRLLVPNPRTKSPDKTTGSVVSSLRIFSDNGEQNAVSLDFM